MNSHLNIYKTYTKVDREGYQLEDDLTRALAIALQENDVFSHQFLRKILNQKEGVYENLFDDYSGKEQIEIDIQKNVESITDFDYLFAVRISGEAMGDDFYAQTHDRDYNPITDMYIKIDNIVIIFEVKPAKHNSTAQLYNQALNTIKGNDEYSMEATVTAVDFNWSVLMQLAVKVNNYQEAIGRPSRLLNNFISYIKMHNYDWLPQLSLSAMNYSNNVRGITKRISDAIENSENSPISNRLGIKCNFGWAQEIIIYISNKTEDILFTVYPGNTKSQGYHIFKGEGEPVFKPSLFIIGKNRELFKSYHIKLAGQSYIEGMWASEKDFKVPLYTKENFHKHSGRKKRDLHWNTIETLLNESFVEEYKWQSECKWEEKIIGSNRTQFDISFGYELSVRIPYKELQSLDTDKNNLNPLIQLINEIKNSFKTILVS